MPPAFTMWFCFALILHLLILTTVSQENVQPTMLYYGCIGRGGNYTTNSTYEANRNQLLVSIYSNSEIDYNFYNFSYGEKTDKVYAIALCRPDINRDSCRYCLRIASYALTRLCPNSKEAMGGYDYCMLRYTNRSIFNLIEETPYFYQYLPETVLDPDQFDQALNVLHQNLSNQAGSGDSRGKFSMGSRNTSHGETIYAMAQCTPDLLSHDCQNCLRKTNMYISNCCKGSVGVRITTPSCQFQYETYQFYNPIAGHLVLPPESPPSKAQPLLAPPPTSATTRTGKANNLAGIVIMIIVYRCLNI